MIGIVRHGAERGKISVNEAGIDLAFAKALRTAQRAKESDVGAHAGDQRVVEGIRQPMQVRRSRVGACAMSLAIIGS